MQDDSGIAPAQSKNRDKVRIPIVVHLFVISMGVRGHIKHYRIYPKY